MRKNLSLLVWAVLCSLWTIHVSAASLERKQLLDEDWLFVLADEKEAASVDYDDSSWRQLCLPHDWSVESDFNATESSGNDGGYVMTGTGWYRKYLTVPAEWAHRKLALYFEGVYMNSEVYVNGQLVGKRPYGYSSFCYDITPYVKFGQRNVIAVRVDNSHQKNCRWYTGSGIYRHVWLLNREPVHVKHWGVYITTPHVSEQQAEVQLQVELQNETDSQRAVSLQVHLQRKGQSAGHDLQQVVLPAWGTSRVTFHVKVDNPALWSPETPSLYEAKLSVEEGGRMVDAVSEVFGIRTFSYSAIDGFRLNGKPILLNGGCVHHDNGVLGAKSYDAAEAWKVSLLKKAGFNAVRTSHNVPSEAFLYECDRQGLLVIDEAFDGWRDAKTPHDYSVLFDQWWQQDVDAMVLRDRNHPSIFCWSIGNEIIERKRIEVVTTARKLAGRIRMNDATRPITSALASWDRDWEIYDPLAAQHDIVGYNYMIHKSESDHERVPERVMMQTESYPRDAFSNWAKVNDHPYIIGDFVWTALDYLGESGIGRFYYKGETEGEHYQANHYPWHGAYCGDIDITGWRKPISHYRELLYNARKKLYMAVKEPNGYYGEIKETQWSVWPTWENWNWPGHEGKTIEVEIYSRYPRVQLFLNGNQVGEQATGREQQFKAVFALPYEAGTLCAVGVDETGKPQEETTLATTGEPVKIRLTAATRQMKADGQDLIYVIAEVLDKQGRVVPTADNRLQFTVKGVGTIEATGSADLKDAEAYCKTSRKVWKGRAVAVIRSTGKAGKIMLKATSPRLSSASVELTAEIGTVHATMRHKDYAVSPAPDSSVPMVHDPVMIKCENTYYLFCTGPGITVMSSQDLKNWKIDKPVFDKAPEWAVQIIPGFKGHIWAPDIIYYQGEYHLFYSCSAFGKNTSAIGHATTPTLNPANPAFKWTDHGMLLQSVPGRDSWNAIDPNIVIDTDGIPWMNFGSFWDGIKLVKLMKDMSAIASPADWHSICRRNYRPVGNNYTEANDNAVEAPFIMRRGAYYYLFVSFDYCCRGAKSNYKIAVGRSTNVTGPYLDKENRSLSAGGGTIILQGNEQWAGVGHCAAYHFDDKDYLIAHGYSIPEEGTSKLILREIHWDENDWPVVYW